MALFVVAYDLYHSKAYNEIIGALEELDSVHTQESVWYVARSGTANGLFDHLKVHIHEKDRLMVVEFSKKPSWRSGMPGTKAWIEKHFPD